LTIRNSKKEGRRGGGEVEELEFKLE